MSILFKKIIVLSLITFSFSIGGVVFAQSGNLGYELLEPTFLGDSISSDYQPGFLDYSELAFNTFLIVVVTLSILMIIIGGLEYTLSPLPGVKESGLNRVWAAVGGLFLALVSVLILNTINPDLVNLNLDFLNQRVGQSIDSNTGGFSGGGNSGGSGNSGGGGGGSNGSGSAAVPHGNGLGVGQYGDVPLNEFTIRASLAENGITVNDAGSCRENDVSACRTYVGNLNPAQIRGVTALKEACGCNVVISGGAEQGGHSAGSDHYDGNAIDVRSNTALTAYLRQNASSFPNLGSYINEGDHWHLEFN